jgi:hypothetical protein
MLVSMVSPSITRVTSTSGQPAQLITVCGGPGPIAGSDWVGVAVELPLEQATSRAANTVVAIVRCMCHRVDPKRAYFLRVAGVLRTWPHGTARLPLLTGQCVSHGSDVWKQRSGGE